MLNCLHTCSVVAFMAIIRFYGPNFYCHRHSIECFCYKQQENASMGARALSDYLFSNALISVVRLIKNSRHVEKQQLNFFI